MPHIFVSGAGVRGRFQDDQLSWAKMFGDGPGGVEDKAHIRFAVFVERGGHADQYGLGAAELRKIRSGLEAACFEPAFNEGRGKVVDVALTGLELFDFVVIYVETDYRKSSFNEFAHQGKPHIAKAYYADYGFSGGNAG